MAKTIHYVEGRVWHLPYTDKTTQKYFTLCGISWVEIKNVFVLHHISNGLEDFEVVTCTHCRKEMKKRGWLREVLNSSYPILTAKALKSEVKEDGNKSR